MPDKYPVQIGMFCDADDCEVEHLGDYVVSDACDQVTRFGYARAHLRQQGWRCDERGDFCPEHAL